MNLNRYNEKLEKSNTYQFLQRHKKVINIIQGFFIIGLMIGMIIYMQNDYAIKKQIKENCGYTTDKYVCVCEKNYVENWEDLKNGNEINLTSNEDNNGFSVGHS